MAFVKKFNAQRITASQYALRMEVYENDVLLASFGFVYVSGKPYYPCYNYALRTIIEYNTFMRIFLNYVEAFERAGRPFESADDVLTPTLF